MVLITGMKILKRIFLFLILVFIFSCERWGSNLIYCPDCEGEEPLKAKLEINLSEHSFTSAVIIKIYEGNLEDSILYATIPSQSKRTSHWVLINKKYTLTARYYFPGKTYIAVDAVTPQVKYDETQCEEPCYYVYDKVVNLRLKYTK
jgi:hypothetical protein